MPGVLYAALGDSVSLDVYPEADHAQRYGRRVRGLGAASLLHRNNDTVWPDFQGKDLSTRFRRRPWTIFAADGATIASVREMQLPLLRAGAEIVTLTAGGNDLLAALGACDTRESLEREVLRIQEAYRRLVAAIAATRAGIVILGTVYDPSDGTGRLPPIGDKLPLELLDATNAVIRETAAAHDNTVLADIHARFLGQGVTAASDASLWYWKENIIEPGYRGGSEVRRLWLEVLQARGILD